MNWRYQPIYYMSGGSPVYGLAEVYLDDDGRLENWTESTHIEASGGTLNELTADLNRMVVDAYRWVPVVYSDLRVGYKFEQAISPEQAEALANMVEASAHNMGEAASPKETPDG